jgi:outer membrane protein assembly factor BamB
MHLPLLLLAALSLPGADAAQNWPQFRGPRGDGKSDATGLPVTWGETKNVVWKTAIHDKGWSSPVVWGDQVWLTTAREDGTRLFAVCVERNTGRVVHDVVVFDVDKPAFCHPANSYASPTPAVEEGRVYVHFGTYGTACLDTKTAKTLWERRDLHCDHYRGPASSPILYGGLLFVHFDGVDVQYLVALDKATGKTAWRKDRGTDFEPGTDRDLKKAYGTPAVITVAGKPQLVSPAAAATTAYDPRTGEELWRVYHGGMNVAAPPLSGLGKVFLCTGDGGLKLLAVRPTGHGDVTATHIDWKRGQGVPSRSSPLLVGDLLYMVNEEGLASCVEGKTGREVWRERLGGRYWASPLYADGRLYFFSEGGVTHVGAAGRSWKELAANKLDAGCMASPAVAGKALFVRTKTHLYRIERQDGGR